MMEYCMAPIEPKTPTEVAPRLVTPKSRQSGGFIDITNIYSNSVPGEGARVRCFPPNVYS